MKNCVDFVVLWVDGNDPEWINEKNKYLKIQNNYSDNDISNNRFRDWDNMKYWFRAVEQYAPWVRTVHFVTWGHIPDFLNTKCEKINIVKHTDFIPAEYLPTFNSCSIELNLHRIKELSEQFVYFNDDMFLTNKIDYSDFFKNGLPKEEGLEGTLSSPGDNNSYFHNILNCMDLINKNFNKREVYKQNLFKYFNPVYGLENVRNIALLPWRYYSGFKNSHLPVPLLKSTLNTVWEKEYKRLDASCRNKFRCNNDT